MGTFMVTSVITSEQIVGRPALHLALRRPETSVDVAAESILVLWPAVEHDDPGEAVGRAHGQGARPRNRAGVEQIGTSALDGPDPDSQTVVHAVSIRLV